MSPIKKNSITTDKQNNPLFNTKGHTGNRIIRAIPIRINTI